MAKISSCPRAGPCPRLRTFTPIAVGFVLVDTERWFWTRTVGAPRDGDPRDGELHQPTREGATFAATQSRQNSLPSMSWMSCTTMHDSLSPSSAPLPARPVFSGSSPPRRYLPASRSATVSSCPRVTAVRKVCGGPCRTSSPLPTADLTDGHHP